jgi:hypothetical protein
VGGHGPGPLAGWLAGWLTGWLRDILNRRRRLAATRRLGDYFQPVAVLAITAANAREESKRRVPPNCRRAAALVRANDFLNVKPFLKIRSILNLNL